MPPERRYPLALGFIAVTAFLVMLLATRWGIATSQDSASYVRWARDAFKSGADGESGAETAHVPPGYSTTLAILSLPGIDPLVAARWLHALLLAANAVIAAELVRRFTGSEPAALFVAVVAAFSYPSIYIYTLALSEPLYIFFALLSLALLASHVERPRWSLLIASALLAGLGVLTRYAGWAGVGAGVTCLLLLPSRPVGRRTVEAILFAAPAAALPVGWAIRNLLVLESATNRVAVWHPVNFGHFEAAGRTAWSWLVADKTVHWTVGTLALLAVLAILIAPLIRARGERTLAGTMALFCLAFVALLTVSISLFDAYTPVDIRILSPVYAAWLIAAGCLIAQLHGRSDKARLLTWVIAGTIGVWSVVRGIDLAYEQFRDGGGFANKQWRESPTVAAARQVSPGKRIYTNAPGAMYLLTGRPTLAPIPVDYNASSGRKNPGYTAASARMRDEIRAGRAVMVYLNRYGRRRPRYPTEQRLQRELRLDPLAKFDDGGVYGFIAPTTAPASTSPAAR